MGEGWTVGGAVGNEGQEKRNSLPRVHLRPWRGVAWARGAAWRTWPVRRSLVPLLEEQQVYLLERGPVLRVPPPAAQHQLVHGVGADGGLREVRLWKQKGEV